MKFLSQTFDNLIIFLKSDFCQIKIVWSILIKSCTHLIDTDYGRIIFTHKKWVLSLMLLLLFFPVVFCSCTHKFKDVEMYCSKCMTYFTISFYLSIFCNINEMECPKIMDIKISCLHQ